MLDKNLQEIIVEIMPQLFGILYNGGPIHDYSFMKIDKVYQNTIYFSQLDDNFKPIEQVPLLISSLSNQKDCIDKVIDAHWKNETMIQSEDFDKLDKQSLVLYTISKILNDKYDINLKEYYC